MDKNMPKVFKLLIALLVFVIPLAHSAEPKYVTVFDNSKQTIWYRSDVIKRDGNASFMTAILNKETQQTSLFNTEYNCAYRRWITNSGVQMDKDGKTIYEQKERDKTWQNIPPNSVYENIYKQVCK